MNAGPENFWASLPSRLTAQEQELADAVVAFLRCWAEEKEGGKSPNLIHLGADKRIRECKSQAMPPEVALRKWLETRVSHLIALVKDGKSQTTVQLAAAR